MPDHTPRRALVTGGSGGLGSAICRRLAADGFHAIVHANGNLGRAEAVVADILDAAAARRPSRSTSPTRTRAAARSRRCCARARCRSWSTTPACTTTRHWPAWAKRSGSASSMFRCTASSTSPGHCSADGAHALGPRRQRLQRCRGAGQSRQANYAAAKSALHGATKSLAREMASRGITANVIAPGVIRGGMADDTFGDEAIKQMVPAGRAGTRRKSPRWSPSCVRTPPATSTAR